MLWNAAKPAHKAILFVSSTRILCRQPDLLKKTIHFFTDPKVGMIQTRWGHLNRGYSLLTRVQAMFLDGHLLLEQTARSRSGRFFNFNGTAGLWRRSCIEEAGGWQHDTLTEDLDLSYRAQLAGWKFIFLPDVVTPAELPVDMNGFKSQQHRWTKGSIQTCKKLLPTIWRSDLPLTIKIEATGHLTSNFAYLLLACLCVLLHPSSGGPAIRLGSNVLDRCSDFPHRFGFGGGILYLCAARTASSHLDEGNAASSMPARAWVSVFRSTMRALFSRLSSIINPTSRAHRNTVSSARPQPWRKLQIHAAQVASPDRRDGLCALF